MGDNVAKEANSGQKDKVFWVLWAIEMLVMLLWLWDELKLEFLSVNPFIYLGFIILLVSLVIKKDFIRERLINAVADTIKKIMPEHMLNERLKKFSIKL